MTVPVPPAAGQSPTLNITDWGRTDYRSALAMQESVVRDRLSGLAGDTLILTEHDPVYTIGVRPGAEKHLLADAATLERGGITVVKTNRGGDITYHGPGQLVGYPVLDISGARDLHRYLRMLEDVLISTIGTLGLACDRRPGKTGIWLDTRKIAAIGVASRRWVTYHGFALNVNNPVEPFAGIIPCGIADGSVTSMARELGYELDLAEVKAVVTTEFLTAWKRFGTHQVSPERVLP